MANLPGPYQVDYEYQVDTLTHHKRFNCIVIGNPTVPTPVASLQLATKGGGNVSLQTGIDNYWNNARLGYSTTTSILSVTLWRFLPGTLNKDFIASVTVTNPLGNGGGSYSAAHQTTLTFRTAGGSIMKDVFIEDTSGLSTRIVLIPSGAGTYGQRAAAYWLSSEGWAIGADDTYPVSALRSSAGQNEAVFNKRFRN